MKSFKGHTTLRNYCFVKLATNPVIIVPTQYIRKSDIVPVYQFSAEVEGTLAGTKLNGMK